MAWRRAFSHYLENRLFEWVMTVGLIGVSLLMLIWPAAAEVGLFRFMLIWLDAHEFTVLFLVFGLLRAVALLANGHWPLWGPRWRLIGAGGSAMLLGQMISSMLAAGPLLNGAPSISLPIYFSLLLGELYSVLRASRAYE